MNRQQAVEMNPNQYALKMMAPRTWGDSGQLSVRLSEQDGMTFGAQSLGQYRAGPGYTYHPITMRPSAPVWAGNNIHQQRMSRIATYAVSRNAALSGAIENAMMSVPARKMGFVRPIGQ